MYFYQWEKSHYINGKKSQLGDSNPPTPSCPGVTNNRQDSPLGSSNFLSKALLVRTQR